MVLAAAAADGDACAPALEGSSPTWHRWRPSKTKSTMTCTGSSCRFVVDSSPSGRSVAAVVVVVGGMVAEVAAAAAGGAAEIQCFGVRFGPGC